MQSEPEFVNFKELRNQFLAWRAGTKTLIDVPARKATYSGGIASKKLITELLECLQIRAHSANLHALLLESSVIF